jgi:hypothetical protein
MPAMLPAISLSVAVLYYGWRDGYLNELKRQRFRHERVAYML